MSAIQQICKALLSLPESKKYQIKLNNITVEKPVSFWLVSKINPDFNWRLVDSARHGVILVNDDNKRYIPVSMNPDGTLDENFVKQFTDLLDKSSMNLRSFVAQLIIATKKVVTETNDFDEEFDGYTNRNGDQVYPVVPDISISSFVIEELSGKGAAGVQLPLGQVTANTPLGAKMLMPLCKYTNALFNIGYMGSGLMGETDDAGSNGKFVRLFRVHADRGHISIARYTLPGSSGQPKVSSFMMTFDVDELTGVSDANKTMEYIFPIIEQLMTTVSDTSTEPTKLSDKVGVYIICKNGIPDNHVPASEDPELNTLDPDEMTDQQYEQRQQDLIRYYSSMVSASTDPNAIRKQVHFFNAVPNIPTAGSDDNPIAVTGVKAYFSESNEHGLNTVISYTMPSYKSGSKDTSGQSNQGFAQLYLVARPEYSDANKIVVLDRSKQFKLMVRESPYTTRYKELDSTISSFKMAMDRLAQFAVHYSAMLYVIDKLQTDFAKYTNSFVHVDGSVDITRVSQSSIDINSIIHCTPLASEVDDPFTLRFWTSDTQQGYDTRVSSDQLSKADTIDFGMSDSSTRKTFILKLREAAKKSVMNLRFGDGRSNAVKSLAAEKNHMIGQSRYASDMNGPQAALAKGICKQLINILSNFWIEGYQIEAENPVSVRQPGKFNEEEKLEYGASIGTSIRLDSGNSGIITVMGSEGNEHAYLSFGDQEYMELQYEIVPAAKGVKCDITNIDHVLHWYMNVPRNLFAQRVRRAYRDELYGAGSEESQVNKEVVETYCTGLVNKMQDTHGEGTDILGSMFGTERKAAKPTPPPEKKEEEAEEEAEPLEEVDDDLYG